MEYKTIYIMIQFVEKIYIIIFYLYMLILKDQSKQAVTSTYLWKVGLKVILISFFLLLLPQSEKKLVRCKKKLQENWGS